MQKGIRGELQNQLNSQQKNLPLAEVRTTQRDPLKELERLGELKQKRLITEAEFQQLKADILKRF